MRDQRHLSITCPRSRTRFPVWLRAATATSLGLVLAGCGASAATLAGPTRGYSTAVSSLPDAAAISWIDGFCGTVDDFLTGANAVGESVSTSEVEDGKRFFSKLLGDYAAIFSKAVDGLTALPPAPDPIGQAAIQTFLGNYTSARDTVTSAKAKLDAASRADFRAVQRAADALGPATQTALSAISPGQAIMASPKLSAARNSAPRCLYP